MSIPKTAGVVIVGGGIVGTATAYYLAKAGVPDVVVLEKNTVCSGSTARCGAGIRAQFGLDLNCRLGLASIEVHEKLSEELGMDTGLNQMGYLLVSYTPEEWKLFQKNIETQHRAGVMTRTLDLKEVKEICPGIDNVDDACGFTFYDRDGTGDPFLTTFALKEGAVRHGAKFYKFTEVKRLLRDDDRIRGVETMEGTILADKVVLASGIWTRDLGRTIGLEFPVYGERHQMIVTEPVEQGVCPTVLMSFSHDFYFLQRPNGTVMCGASPPNDFAGNYRTTASNLYKIGKSMMEILPRTRDIRIVRHWSGFYDMTPDASPLFGGTEVDGLYVSCGYSGHGYMVGPVAGKVMTELILGQKTSFDMSVFDYHRFERGETILEPMVDTDITTVG